VSMPFTESGLWVPHESRRRTKKVRWWRGFTLPVVVSTLSVIIAAGSLWVTRYNTQVSQRAYLSYDFQLDDIDGLVKKVNSKLDDVLLKWSVRVQNLGNTPARGVKLAIASNIRTDFTVTVESIVPLNRDIRPKETGVFEGITILTMDRKHNTSLLPVLNDMIWGFATYKDVFDASHSDHICYGITVIGKNKPWVALCGNEEMREP
jgi:hypothetical protein